MKRTEIPAVKVWTTRKDGTKKLDADKVYPRPAWGDDIPCILRTAAADKLILDVVRAALKQDSLPWQIQEAVYRLGNAGVKL